MNGKNTLILVFTLLFFSLSCNTEKMNEIAIKRSILYSVWRDAGLDTSDLAFVDSMDKNNWEFSIYEDKFGQTDLWPLYFTDSVSIDQAGYPFRKLLLMDYLISYARGNAAEIRCGLQADQIRVSSILARPNEGEGANPVVVKLGLFYRNIDTLLPFMLIKGREHDTIHYDLTFDEFEVKKIDGMDTLEADIYIYNRVYKSWLPYSIMTRTYWE